jgi:hypothetical protein
LERGDGCWANTGSIYRPRVKDREIFGNPRARLIRFERGGEIFVGCMAWFTFYVEILSKGRYPYHYKANQMLSTLGQKITFRFPTLPFTKGGVGQ